MANSVNPDQMVHYGASVLGLHCLFRPVWLNTYGKYGHTEPAGDQDIIDLTYMYLIHNIKNIPFALDN